MNSRLKSEYQALVDSGNYFCDEAQLLVLAALGKIQLALETKSRPGKGFWRGLFGKPVPPIKGLYLWGGVGAGKSMLMDLFFSTTAIARKRRVHFHGFMQEVHEAINRLRKQEVADPIAKVAQGISDEVDLLCFDEMQIGDITDAMIVGRLFEALFALGVVSVTTSNRRPDALYKDGLNRQLFLPFIALLKTHMDVHHLKSETDYRQDKLRGHTTYFTPITKAAKHRIETIWQDLSGGTAEPLVLTVKSRAVRLPLFHNGVARARFADLCEKPLGAVDYLAIAEVVRALVLEDIPLMSRERNNEAKRFVTLIDTLYEAKVQLICSAEANPDALFVDGEGSFEFARTASRLHEMQSADWGRDEEP